MTRRRVGVGARQRLRRCAICGGRVGTTGHFLRDAEDATSTERRTTWHLCADCYDAVGREMERASLRTRARARVAVGIVAAERGHPLRSSFWDERYWEQLTDRGQDRLLIWFFGVAFVVHAVAFMVVALYVAIHH